MGIPDCLEYAFREEHGDHEDSKTGDLPEFGPEVEDGDYDEADVETLSRLPKVGS